MRARTRATAELFALIMVGLGASACAGEEEPLAEGELILHEVGPDGLEASLIHEGEQVLVSSRSVDGVRTIRISGEDSTVHAEWRIDVNTTDITGSMGGRTFGRYEDADTDMDPSYWLEVEASHSGAVIAAVSSAAAPLGEREDLVTLADDIEGLTRMAPYLSKMAQPRVEEARGACDMFYNLYHMTAGWNQHYIGAVTRTTGSCPSSNNCAFMYNYPSGYQMYTGCRVGTGVDVGHWDTDAWPFSSINHCRKSKHWTTYVPARWIGPRCWQW